MTRYRSLEELARGEINQGDFGIALGVFDGVHLGHQAVIQAVKSFGRTGVLTFEPHPIQILAPERAPRKILASLEHKEKILKDHGVDFMIVIPFTKEFAMRDAMSFAEELANSGVSQLSAGDDWVFGKERRGNMKRLAEWCPGVQVWPVPAVMLHGERVSSTRIRQCLRDGNLKSASEMLGRAYAVYGEVKEGEKLGRTIGFPTANVALEEEQLPGNGVYVVNGRWKGEWIRGVANVGVKPTVSDQNRRSLEVHFLEQNVPDHYGWKVEVAFLKKIREEAQFSSLEELKEQIAKDVEEGLRF